MGKGRNAGEGAAGLSKSSAKKGEEVRGEEGETKEMTLSTAFSRRVRGPEQAFMWTTGVRSADTNGPTGIIRCGSACGGHF